MANVKVDASKLAITVGDYLKTYDADVAKAFYTCTEETAEKTVDELKSASAAYGWKKYPKAWTYDLKQIMRGRTEAIVHLKKPMYRIGHLLEFGHITREAGRTPPKPGKKTFVDARPHAEDVANRMAEEYEQKLKDMIGDVE